MRHKRGVILVVNLAMICLLFIRFSSHEAVAQSSAIPAPGHQSPPLQPSAATLPLPSTVPKTDAPPTASVAVSGASPIDANPGQTDRRVNVFDMVRNADPVVQGTMAFLLLCSAGSWAALIEKSLTLALVKRHIRRLTAALHTMQTMDDMDTALAKLGDGPARGMWLAAKQEWDLSLRLTGTALAADQITRLLQRLVLAMGSRQEQALLRLGNWMGLLATIGSTAPFIGLFGTVWGILDSFEHIAIANNTSLSAVAPGIAEALLATAAGLFAAIPATIFYNRFARSIGQITGALDNITADLIAFASRDIERFCK